ncbi:hypothetical protein CRENPOLYSF2_10008 [Crenothrix polyspora]|uniref:Uncharacterized protein n=1 Tax=Crenothrix polyspora TaxID=360316 RepID=A0A1R4GYS5_9GAMM|nr:hypothetical protein [Crenothrix polyspora]SJM88960.1 hypothetical protein CRENPOLYSF2_10008 [Crenothrix polyspora]
MKVAIELPDELGKQFLQQANVKFFIQEAVKKMLLEQKQAIEHIGYAMSSIPNSVSLADELMLERRLEAKKEQQENE